MQVSSFFAGPERTPRPIKLLIWAIVATSFLSPILTFALNHYLQIPGPSQWLPLSSWGLLQGWVWQPITYMFIHSAGVGISLSLLISLFFHMLLLWFAGSEVENRYGTRAFLLFFFGGALLVGLLSAATLLLFSSQTLIIGSGPPIYALVMVWAMLYPDLELFFFFFLRLKAKWLVALFLGIALLINLSYGQFIPFFADLFGIAWGFLIGRFVWKLPNPYPLNLSLPKRPGKKNRGGNIIDISVMHESDAAFMDRMLDKIARRGQDSLTRRERDRMEKISKKNH